MKLKKISSAIFFLTFLILTPFAAKAANPAPIHIIDNTSGNYATGNYQLTDAMALVIKFSTIILQVVGVLTFAMFIYGGFLFLISAGNQQTVSKAKKILLAAVIGLVIVFTSYTLVQFFINSIAAPTYQMR